jgi:hypothetical protein
MKKCDKIQIKGKIDAYTNILVKKSAIDKKTLYEPQDFFEFIYKL